MGGELGEVAGFADGLRVGCLMGAEVGVELNDVVGEMERVIGSMIRIPRFIDPLERKKMEEKC